MANEDEESCYVYLDFNEKLTPSIFANKMFLRIANLDKPNPLVQLNDLLFKGVFDECVGTNLFFEEAEDSSVTTNIFAKNSPIRLKPTILQTKLIKLQQVKLPRNVSTDKHVKESIELHLNQDYNSVLEKLEQGVLNLEDMAEKDTVDPVQDPFEDITFESNENFTTEPEREIDTVLEGAAKNLEAKYERLKRLARRPVKRMTMPELVQECDPQYRERYEYHNLERQICQSSDAFRSVSCPIIEKSFIGGIDVERCVLQGLLPCTDLDHILTKEEQLKVFSMDNFENLSLPARYLILKECVTQIEELIENTSREELQETDENGRTITDICNIFRKLVHALEFTIQSCDSDELNVSVRTDLSGRPDDEYVKYRFRPEQELFTPSREIFNSDEWTDTEDQKDEAEGKAGRESDESVSEESD